MKNEEKVVTNQTIIDEGTPVDMPKNITEAFNKFLDLNITALKDSSNPYFKSTYADLTSVIFFGISTGVPSSIIVWLVTTFSSFFIIFLSMLELYLLLR